MTVKEKLRLQYLKPKKVLRKERMAQDISITSMAVLIGVNRNAYASKEKGLCPFSDYEMKAIASYLKLPIEYLFFID